VCFLRGRAIARPSCVVYIVDFGGGGGGMVDNDGMDEVDSIVGNTDVAFAFPYENLDFRRDFRRGSVPSSMPGWRKTRQGGCD